jgi:hypothetical protein
MPETHEPVPVPKPAADRDAPKGRDDRRPKGREASRYSEELPSGTFRIPRV